MKFILPAKSRIAVQSVKPGSTPQWYVTKDAVEVPEVRSVVKCPIRADRNVETHEHKGFRLFFLPEQVTVKLEGADLQRVVDLQLYKLEYDISPEQVQELGYGHPSQWLWSYSIRTTKSCWCIPKDRIPWERLDRMTEVGATWSIAKYDPSEAANLLGQCILAVRREMQEQAARNVESADETARKAAEANLSPDRADKRFSEQAKAIDVRTTALAARLKGATKVFGIPERFIQQSQASVAVSAIKTGMQERARQFAAAIRAAREANTTDGAAVAAAASAGAMEPAILADYIQENVSEAQGEQLRTAFADDNGVFNLVDENDAA